MQVIDVKLINDWGAFFLKHMDSHLSLLHKQLHTQHQIMWTAVPHSEWYPIGVSVVTRAHPPEVTIEGVMLDDKEKAADHPWPNCKYRFL